MNDGFDLVAFKGSDEVFLSGHIAMYELRLRLGGLKAGTQVVIANGTMAVLEQLFDYDAADVACAAGHQYIHAFAPLRKGFVPDYVVSRKRRQ